VTHFLSADRQPLSLTDRQRQILIAMSRSLSPVDRPLFLESVAEALAEMPELGDGAVAKQSWTA
jgi:hypothetical protein